MPDPTLLYRIITDAGFSLVVGAIRVGARLGPQPVAFASKRLSQQQAEANYSIRDKELLYVLGQTFVVCTNHESLQYLLTQTEELSGCLARYAEESAEVDLSIQHIRAIYGVETTLRTC